MGLVMLDHQRVRIASLTATDGHLRDVGLDFSPGLNCIIGARGTCKSTIVETLRFLFNSEPERIVELLSTQKSSEDAVSHQGLIAATLRGGTARMVLRPEPSDPYAEVVVERDTTSESRAYVDGIQAISDQSILGAVEIYSQGELQEIALSSAKRLGLIDRPHQAAVDESREQASRLATEIAQTGPRIRKLRDSIDAAERRLREGEPTRAKLNEVRAKRPKLAPDLAVLREQHQAAERLLSRAQTAVEQAHKDRANIEAAAAAVRSTANLAEEFDRGPASVLTNIAGELAQRHQALSRAIASFQSDAMLDEAIASARSKLEEASTPYFAARKREEQVSEALREEDRLTDEVSRLDRIAEELATHRSQLKDLEAQRAEMRARLASIRNQLYHRRVRDVDRINADFSDRIILSLNHGTQTDTYRETLDDLLTGSRLREQPALCRQLATVLPPAEFVSHVEREDAAGLAEILNRDEGQMLRLISHVTGLEALYALEQDISEDELEITMVVDGRPRSVSEMSKGQKATAILPLLLRSAPYPLILDQPEDDLDNRFVYRTLVKTVERLKEERQLIFVTHNANIPVIGDAERVFVMAMADQDRAVIEAQGTVDEVKNEILSLLEGGKEAFERRGETYGLASHDPE